MVGIKDLEFPKNCKECKFKFLDFCGDNYCMLKPKTTFTTSICEINRQLWCPIFDIDKDINKV